MSEITRIHASRQPRRPHYIKEWAELRGFSKQAELAAEIGADKSLISRWYAGASPTTEYQEKLAALFSCEPEALFRHPDDDWIAKFFQGREREEIERIKHTLETAFPLKTGTEG